MAKHWKGLLVVVVIGAAIAATTTFGIEEKVTICHFPSGNPENPQTITIGKSAVAKHLEEHKGEKDGVEFADYTGRCRNPVTDVKVCSSINTISAGIDPKSGATDDAILAAYELAYDASTLVEKYDPATYDLYYNKLTSDQQNIVQKQMVEYFNVSPCISFCTLTGGKGDTTVGGGTTPAPGCDPLAVSCNPSFTSPCESGNYVERLGTFTSAFTPAATPAKSGI